MDGYGFWKDMKGLEHPESVHNGQRDDSLNSSVHIRCQTSR